MGWSLGDIAAGAIGGFGAGLATIGKEGMAAQQQEEMDKRREEMDIRKRELDAQREIGLAKLRSSLAGEQTKADYAMKAPEREFDQGLRSRSQDNTERATTGQIDSSQRNYEVSRDQANESARHNKATEQIGANNTEARINIAEMNAENRRLAAGLRDAEKAAQLPKEQIEYLKGFSTNRGKVLSDTLMPEADKKKALATLDADLYANYPPMIQRNEDGQFRTRDVLGRSRTFENEKELIAAGFPPSKGAKQPAAATSAEPSNKMSAAKSSEWVAQLSKLSDERLKEIVASGDETTAPIAQQLIKARAATAKQNAKDQYSKLPKEPNLVDMMRSGNYGDYGTTQ